PVTDGLGFTGVDYQRPLVSIGPPADDLTTDTGSNDTLAAVTRAGGGGNVVFVSDSDEWSDAGAGADTPITYGDNRRLLSHIVEWIISTPDRRCRAGNVNGAVGPITDLLFLH